MADIFDEIIQNLKKINPLRIILFGSYAKGQLDEESDIDLVVIVDTDVIPESYDQKLEYYKYILPKIQ